MLLIPLAAAASGLWQAPLNEAMTIVDSVTTSVSHLFQSPQSDQATIGDTLSTVSQPLLHSPQNDVAQLGDSVVTHIFHLWNSTSIDSANLADQVTITFIRQATSTGLQATANPSVYGNSVTLTATVIASSVSPGAGDGTVTFVDGGTSLCNAQSLTGNQATCLTSSLDAGSHAITATYSGSSRYGASAGNLTEQVNPAPLTVTADDKTKVYGAPNPAFTVSYTGFVNGDNAALLSGSLTFAAPPATSPVGTYTAQIVPSGLTSSNYAITYVRGTLTITPALLTITANDATRVYGAPNPAFSVSYSGLVNGDGPAALGGTLTFTTAPAGSGVGTYPIAPSGLTSSNYTMSFANGRLTITPASLAVRANGVDKFYGQPNPAFSISVIGLVNADQAGVVGAPVFTTLATQTSPVGSYSIVPSVPGNQNYTVTYVNGTLTVRPAPTATALTATPNPAIVKRSVSLTATVTTAAQNGINPGSDGTVAFYFGSTLLGSGPISGSGVATLNLATLPVGHDSLTAVYTPASGNYTGSASPAVVEQVLQNRIVFSSNRDGNFEIYSVNPDGTDPTRLTTNPAVDTNPAVSPDGTKIAFVSTRGGTPQIWVMNTDGTNPRQLTTGSCLAATPAWSSDGKKIAYTSIASGSAQIWAVATNGTYPNSTSSQLTPNTFATANTMPAWSPDGTRIAFTSTHSGLAQIWVMNADGGGPIQLTPNIFALADTSPTWSPDGTQIAFTSTKPGPPAIYLMRAAGANPMRLTNDGLAIDATPTWSTDGQQLAFTTTIGGVVEIYVINTDGSSLTRLTNGPAMNALPSWSTPAAP